MPRRNTHFQLSLCAPAHHQTHHQFLTNSCLLVVCSCQVRVLYVETQTSVTKVPPPPPPAIMSFAAPSVPSGPYIPHAVEKGKKIKIFVSGFPGRNEYTPVLRADKKINHTFTGINHTVYLSCFTKRGRGAAFKHIVFAEKKHFLISSSRFTFLEFFFCQ